MSTCKANGDVVAYTGPKVTYSPPPRKSDRSRIADALERIAAALEAQTLPDGSERPDG